MSHNITISSNKLVYGSIEYRCTTGRGGITNNKKEGDGATPTGCFPIREVLYRADRVEKPKTVFPLKEIKQNDGWCDDPKDEKYNQFVNLPYSAHAENLWRDDEIYDIIVVLGYNDDPVIQGKGSAIFMHIARLDYSATDGCIALSRKDLLKIISMLQINDKICIE